jgi:hypothetical protein
MNTSYVSIRLGIRGYVLLLNVCRVCPSHMLDMMEISLFRYYYVSRELTSRLFRAYVINNSIMLLPIDQFSNSSSGCIAYFCGSTQSQVWYRQGRRQGQC